MTLVARVAAAIALWALAIPGTALASHFTQIEVCHCSVCHCSGTSGTVGQPRLEYRYLSEPWPIPPSFKWVCPPRVSRGTPGTSLRFREIT